MKTLHLTAKFKRELKKIKRSTSKQILNDLNKVIEDLLNETPLPERFKDHPLTGDLVGFRDCHIRSDLVLIYKQTPDVLYLTRIGSHSELLE